MLPAWFNVNVWKSVLGSAIGNRRKISPVSHWAHNISELVSCWFCNTSNSLNDWPAGQNPKFKHIPFWIPCGCGGCTHFQDTASHLEFSCNIHMVTQCLVPWLLWAHDRLIESPVGPWIIFALYQALSSNFCLLFDPLQSCLSCVYRSVSIGFRAGRCSCVSSTWMAYSVAEGSNVELGRRTKSNSRDHRQKILDARLAGLDKNKW